MPNEPVPTPETPITPQTEEWLEAEVNDIAYWVMPENRAVFKSAMRQAIAWGLTPTQALAIFHNAYDAAARNGHQTEETWY